VSTVVVSDASPLRALAHLGLLQALPRLFEEVLVPPAVVAELSVPLPGIAPIDFGGNRFVTVRAPVDQKEVARLQMTLGAGESQAIALALETRPDFLLIDEATGRRVAVRLGLRPLGVIGILAELKRSGVIELVGPLIDRLIADLKFRLAPDLVREVLESVGE
jgi:predicted nucleic acid-binding protein